MTETHRLWHKSTDKGWLGTGVAHEGDIYVCDMGGLIHCIDIQTGEIRWQHRSGGGGTWSSMTQTANGMMYLLTKSGTTTVFRPNRQELKRVAENELNEATNTSVVAAASDIFIRTDKALWCFSDPGPDK